MITSSIKIDGTVFAIMANGKFGRIETDNNGKWTFALLSKPENKNGPLGRHYLYHV